MENIEITKIGILYYITNKKNIPFKFTTLEDFNMISKYSNKISSSYEDYILKERITYEKAEESDVDLNSVNYSIQTQEERSYTRENIDVIEKDSDFKGWVTNKSIISYIKHYC